MIWVHCECFQLKMEERKRSLYCELIVYSCLLTMCSQDVGNPILTSLNWGLRWAVENHLSNLQTLFYLEP